VKSLHRRGLAAAARALNATSDVSAVES
jgi:hypothetical protein